MPPLKIADVDRLRKLAAAHRKLMVESGNNNILFVAVHPDAALGNGQYAYVTVDDLEALLATLP